MSRRPAMPPSPDLETLRRLQHQIEAFVQSLDHPVVFEDEVELFDLTAARWQLKVEFAKLILEVWNPARSMARRVEDIAYRDRGRLGIFVRKPGARATTTLEFRTLARTPRRDRASERARARQALLGVLAKQFPGRRFERISHRTDREHSFSTWYTRGWARQGTGAWAFLGLRESETAAAADVALASGLIWLDWLRSQPGRVTVSGLKLFLPSEAVELTAHRAAFVDPQSARIEIFEWRGKVLRPIDVQDFGNVETNLVPRRRGEGLAERHRDLLRRWLGDLLDRVSVVPDASGAFLSLRVLGLEVARVEGQLAPRIYWGLEGQAHRLEDENLPAFLEFLQSVLRYRVPRPPEATHEFFRLQAERWLESVLVRDISKIDPALSPAFVYPQVPTVAGLERGLIDILTATRTGRLAVIELKLEEEINLPFQALDYWLRVRWLHERSQFQPAGYFSGFELAPSPPWLYLVSPAFRFHSTLDRLVRYLSPSVQCIQVGLNDRWRESVRVLFRREWSRGRGWSAAGQSAPGVDDASS